MFEGNNLLVVLLSASLIVNLITMILVIVTFRKNKAGGAAEQVKAPGQTAAAKQTKPAAAVSGVIFCRNCGNQYDSELAECPKCK